MTTLGNALLGEILGHSEAEKVFRPWWDSLEDFVIYSLILLGLIVSPTTIFNGSPLSCTQCTELSQCGPHPSTSEKVGFSDSFVKAHCTYTSVTIFTMYFPYILLLSALALAGIEILFSRVFKTNIQIDGFYSLLKGEEALKNLNSFNTETGDTQPDNMLENTILTVEVRQSFKGSRSFHSYYVFRTVLEFLLAFALGFILIFFGAEEIYRDKMIFCDLHGIFFECTGIPHHFYLTVLVAALCLLALYLISTFLTLCWLICPCFGLLARLMRNYSNELASSAMAEGRDGTATSQLMGELYEIYYNNRDLRLLLDLLAAKSGLASPLRIMALMDSKFRCECQPIIHMFDRSSEIIDCESEAIVEFSESQLASTVLSKLTEIHLLYTVQLFPRTDKNSMEVVVFDRERDSNVFRVDLSYFQKPNGKISAGQMPKKRVTFHGVDSDKTYTVIITLVMNGRAIAATQKTLKPIPPPTVLDS